jgi:hypothetical protein
VDVPDELVQWIAYRPSTGERFEHLSRPVLPLSPSTSFHTELAEDALTSAPDRRALLEAFARWTRPTDVVASWGEYGPNLYVRSGGEVGERLDVRLLAAALTNKKLGPLEGFAESIGPPRPAIGAGRGGRRLAALVQIVEHLRVTFA